ncbi:DUF4180 domain-containing protein [Xenorhabdus sp. KK7.4]|uniref:DUF4180 domain-containing protein n=1 Tax=Xenorhabdus sp. KK7.4 TaxID=1851572 RepID=UPI00210FA1DA|nr:DUF4180 domain-containing protein [Xenorhabdus sp. KK7.4]
MTDTPEPFRSWQDVINIILSHEYRNIADFIINEACFHPDFFILKTEIAGEILQAFVNYRVKVAILGDMTKYTNISTSFRAFVVESHKNNQLFFVSEINDAIRYLSSTKNPPKEVAKTKSPPANWG